MKLFKLLILLSLCFGYSAAAQESSMSLPLSLNSGDILLAKRGLSDYFLELWKLEPLTGGLQPFLNLGRDGYRIQDLTITLDREYLFILEIEELADTGFAPLGESHIVRMNLKTGEREILFSSMNMLDFKLSSDSNRALVHFYPADMIFVDRTDLTLREQWCIVEFEQNPVECHRLNIDEGVFANGFEWLSNNMLVYTLNDAESIQIVNTESFTEKTINLPQGVSADEIRAIPNTENILGYDKPFTQGEVGSLFLIDTANETTHTIRDLAYPPMNMMELSPDSNFLVMAGADIAILIDLQTGEIIQTYPTMYDMNWARLDWLSTDNTFLMLGQLNFKGNNIMAVLFEPYFNVAVNILPNLTGKILIVP